MVYVYTVKLHGASGIPFHDALTHFLRVLQEGSQQLPMLLVTSVAIVSLTSNRLQYEIVYLFTQKDSTDLDFGYRNPFEARAHTDGPLG